MLTIRELKELKHRQGFTNEMIAKRSGVPLGTVQKIFAGITKSPRRETLLALEEALKKEESTVKGNDLYGTKIVHDPVRYDNPEGGRNLLLREGNAPLEKVPYPGAPGDPNQGNYTLDDYYALPEERRVELIDGVIYDMTCPLRVHQAILGQLYLQLAPCVEQHPECELFFAPADVRLDNDNKTILQPDLYIVCGKNETDKRRLNGAPDFVIEILSPSNRKHDMYLKLKKYRYAGVREYWIVDPQGKKVLVYRFENDEFPTIYTFEDTIPVGISEGECSVDFKRIAEKTDRYQ